MAKSPKSKGAAKEAIQPEAPRPIEGEGITDGIYATPEEVAQVIEEAAEEAQPIPSPAPDIRTMNEIYVTIAPYSSAYKKLSAEQHKNDPSLARGAIILMGRQFDPQHNYRVEKTPEVDKLIKEGLLISMTGSFRFRVRDEPKAREVAEHADD
jgi:hypothetical protein